jgi:hypothetical protein
MSRIGNLARLGEADLVALLEHPEQIEVLLHGEPGRDSGRSGNGWLARLFGTGRLATRAIDSAWKVLPEHDRIDIEKSWHVLHFLFTGSDWEGEFPEGFLVSGGATIDRVDACSGTARFFTPEETAEIARFLGELCRDELRGRLKLKKMEEFEIYPQFWKDADRVEEEWEIVCEGLDRITPFVKEAAERKMALLIFID